MRRIASVASADDALRLRRWLVWRGSGQEPLHLAAHNRLVQAGRLGVPLAARSLQVISKRPFHEVVPDGSRDRARLQIPSHRTEVGVAEPESGCDGRCITDRPAIAIVL